jgi:hypothetical protein
MSEQKLRELGRYFLETYAEQMDNAVGDMAELERYRNESSYPVESYLWPIYRRLQQLEGSIQNLRKYLKEKDNA